MSSKPNGNHLTDVAEIEGQTALHVVEGYVWCDRLNEVHGDTLNPQAYIDNGTQDYCKPEDHRAMFMDSDDNVNPRWDDREPIEPMPVRSAPVPLTVRRHTPESKNIWWQNLYNALPADLMDEDREKITTALLEVAISHGDELRRKRLVDKLMAEADHAERYSEGPGPDTYSVWADVMRDAAEEIRSLL